MYIYTNVDPSFFENAANYPEGFNSETDLLIGDYTRSDNPNARSDNPNMYAYHAHKIDPQNRQYIIEIMQMYDEDFNTPWDRTNDSLEVEWEAHHLYRIANSAKNIDFDNGEEGFTKTDYHKKAGSRIINKISSILNSIFG